MCARSLLLIPRPVSCFRSLRLPSLFETEADKKAPAPRRAIAVARPLRKTDNGSGSKSVNNTNTSVESMKKSRAVVGVVEPRVVVKIPWSKVDQSPSNSPPSCSDQSRGDSPKSGGIKSISSEDREMTSGDGRRSRKRRSTEDITTTAAAAASSTEDGRRSRQLARSESSKLNPESRKKKRRRRKRDDGRTSEAGSGSKRRKIPEINFEMEKLQEGRRRKRGEGEEREVDGQGLQQQFSITETLPEHFRRALVNSLLKQLPAAAAANSVSSLANEEGDVGGRGPISDNRSSRINPLKLIRRFVPGTNQEEYKVEGHTRRLLQPGAKPSQKNKGDHQEQVVVDLASDDEDYNGLSVHPQKEKSISEEYLRSRMPLINVSLVGKKAEESTTTVRPVSVMLERLSDGQIEKHLDRGNAEEDVDDSEEDEEEREIFGRRSAMKMRGFEDLHKSRGQQRAAAAANLNGLENSHQTTIREVSRYQSYRSEDVTASKTSRIGSLSSSPVPPAEPARDCENLVHKEGRVDSLADGLEGIRIAAVMAAAAASEREEDAVSTLSTKEEERNEAEQGTSDEGPISAGSRQMVTAKATCSAWTAGGGSQRRKEKKNNREITTAASTPIASNHFLDGAADECSSNDSSSGGGNEDINLEPFSSTASTAIATAADAGLSMPLLFSDRGPADDDFSNLLAFQTLDMQAIKPNVGQSNLKRGAGQNPKSISGGQTETDGPSGTASSSQNNILDEIVLDGDIISLSSSDSGDIGKARTGRPRKFRKTIGQIEEESANRKKQLILSAESLPPVEPLAPSLLQKADITFEESSEDDKWMYCPRSDCNFWTRKQHRMERHRRCHPANGSRFFECPEPGCGMTFVHLKLLLRHDRKEHTGEKDYECKICEAEVTDINVHMKVS